VDECTPLIVGYAAKPADEVVNSWVRVLGDRSTLFKYLSPNVIFVAASPKGAAAADSAVTVHLLDAATGRVLYRVRQGRGLRRFPGYLKWRSTRLEFETLSK
jgi:hypothetical protein